MQNSRIRIITQNTKILKLLYFVSNKALKIDNKNLYKNIFFVLSIINKHTNLYKYKKK